MSDQESKQRRRNKFARDQQFRRENYGSEKARREAENRKRHRKAA